MAETVSQVARAATEYRAARARDSLRRACVLALVLGLARTPSALAHEIEGVRFAPQVQARDVTLALHGVGLLRWRWVVKAYVAGLYLPESVAAPAALDDVPKRLEIHYFHAIDGGAFGPAAEKVLRASLDGETLARLRPRLDTLSRLYEDVRPGDRYALTYLPGVGTELALNGVPRGTIPGADFAAAYFSIWLGKSPIDSALRAQLVEGL
jgi:hypothetical protein